MGEVWLTDAADIRMNRYPSFPSSEAAKTHSDSSEAKPPPCSMELPSLPHTHKYTFSHSLSHLIFYLMVASVS